MKPGERAYPLGEIALPPTHRFNAGIGWNRGRSLGSVSVNYSGKAFWSDVLDDRYAGFTDAYMMVNASAGVKWLAGRLVTTIKGLNLLDRDIHQHLFGDVLKRSVVLDVRYNF